MQRVVGYVVSVHSGVRVGQTFRFAPSDDSDAAYAKARRAAYRKVDRLDNEYGACCATVSAELAPAVLTAAIRESLIVADRARVGRMGHDELVAGIFYASHHAELYRRRMLDG